MRNIEYRIRKLEQTNKSGEEAVLELLNKSNLNVLEKTGILVDAGFLDGETIAKWIMEGNKNG